MPTLTEAQVLSLAKGYLRVHGLTYDQQEGLKAEYLGSLTNAGADATPAWCVAYLSQPGMFDQHDFFMYLADETGTLLHILGPHGKLRLQE